MKKVIKDIYQKVENYDSLLRESQKQWREIKRLRPKSVDDLEFHKIIMQARLSKTLIENFKKENVYECKSLIYHGANKEYLYDYVSNLDKDKLTVAQQKLLYDLHNVDNSRYYPCCFDKEISDVREITEDEYSQLLAKLKKGEEFNLEELDKFIFKKPNENKFIAINNITGKILMEEFKSRENAEKYLRGQDIEELKRDEESIYKILIYETENDYEQGEPFELLEMYTDIEKTIKELENTIRLNNYYSGNIIEEETGKEIYSFYSEKEQENEVETTYKYIFRCTLEGYGSKFENQYLLVSNPQNFNPDLEVMLTGDLHYSSDYKISNLELVKIIEYATEVLEFCNQNHISLPKERIKEGGLVIGGEKDMIIDWNLKAKSYGENIEEQEDYNEEMGE